MKFSLIILLISLFSFPCLAQQNPAGSYNLATPERHSEISPACNALGDVQISDEGYGDLVCGENMVDAFFNAAESHCTQTVVISHDQCMCYYIGVAQRCLSDFYGCQSGSYAYDVLQILIWDYCY